MLLVPSPARQALQPTEMLNLGMPDGFGREPRCPSKVFPPRHGRAGLHGCSRELCWLSMRRELCQEPVLGTPGSSALGSNRFLRFLGRSAGCVRSGRCSCRLLSLGSKPLPPSPRPRPHREMGNGGSPSPRGGRRVSGWERGVQDAHRQREPPFSLFPAVQPPPQAENPAAQQMPDEVQEENSCLPTEMCPGPTFACLQKRTKKKPGVNRLVAGTASPKSLPRVSPIKGIITELAFIVTASAAACGSGGSFTAFYFFF